MKKTWIRAQGVAEVATNFKGQKQSQGSQWLMDDGPVVGHGIREVVIGQIMRFITAAVGSHRKDLGE